MTKKTSRLEKLRAKIDLLDDRIVDLLVERYELASEIGRTKQEDGAPVKDSEREDLVLERIRKRARKPLSGQAAEKIYKVVLKESRGIQVKKRTKGA